MTTDLEKVHQSRSVPRRPRRCGFPAPVVLFEYVKGLVTSTRPDVGRVETISRAEMG